MTVRLWESWLYQETVLKIQKLFENVCKTQSLLLTYFRTLSEDGKLFERIGVLFLLLTFVSLFSRIGYGKVFFLSL